MSSPDTSTVGVIIARFQSPDLHAGHRAVIDAVCARHQMVLILLGYVPDVMPNRHDPMIPELRIGMVTSAYPHVAVATLANHPSNQQWSNAIDRVIGEVYPNGPTRAILYGGRDNKLTYYTGIHHTETLDCNIPVSGTEERAKVTVQHTAQFRAGVIYGVSHRHDISFQCVDMAVFKGDQLLVGRKATDPPGCVRLPGGFVDPKDASLEVACSRELWEEVGMIEVAKPWQYVTSMSIPDWRYRDSPDGIKSALFATEYLFGAVEASDDLEWAGFLPIADVSSRINPVHQPLLSALIVKYPTGLKGR